MEILNAYPRIFYYVNTTEGEFRVNLTEIEPLEIFDHCEWKHVNPGLDISLDDFYSILDYVRNLHDH